MNNTMVSKSMDEYLCHVTTHAALTVERLVGVPFLHCCTEAQLPFVLAKHFSNRTGLLVLRFNPAGIVDGHIRWERTEPDMDPFPHLYGSLPVSLVRAEAAPGPWG